MFSRAARALYLPRTTHMGRTNGVLAHTKPMPRSVNQLPTLSQLSSSFHSSPFAFAQESPTHPTSAELIEENKGHAAHNVPPSIALKLGRQLHLQEGHPLSLIRTRLEAYFTSRQPGMRYYNNLEPAMNTVQAFDELLFPPDHPGRSPTDTYYINDRTSPFISPPPSSLPLSSLCVSIY